MGFAAANGALAMCTFGVAPTPLTFLPTSMVLSPVGPIGTCAGCVPFLNVKPFGVCMSLANPITAALTAAAFGVLTPGPCIPVPAGIWIPMKPTVITAMGPILTQESMLMCAYGGQIRMLMPAQFAAMT